jgi:hypothetical protein
MSGGPGGSGIGQVLRGGKNVRTILSAGPDADKQTAKVRLAERWCFWKAPQTVQD